MKAKTILKHVLNDRWTWHDKDYTIYVLSDMINNIKPYSKYARWGYRKELMQSTTCEILV